VRLDEVTDQVRSSGRRVGLVDDARCFLLMGSLALLFWFVVHCVLSRGAKLSALGSAVVYCSASLLVTKVAHSVWIKASPVRSCSSHPQD
jgi:hypothetical protein